MPFHRADRGWLESPSVIQQPRESALQLLKVERIHNFVRTHEMGSNEIDLLQAARIVRSTKKGAGSVCGADVSDALGAIAPGSPCVALPGVLRRRIFLAESRHRITPMASPRRSHVDAEKDLSPAGSAERVICGSLDRCRADRRLRTRRRIVSQRRPRTPKEQTLRKGHWQDATRRYLAEREQKPPTALVRSAVGKRLSRPERNRRCILQFVSVPARCAGRRDDSGKSQGAISPRGGVHTASFGSIEPTAQLNQLNDTRSPLQTETHQQYAYSAGGFRAENGAVRRQSRTNPALRLIRSRNLCRLPPKRVPRYREARFRWDSMLLFRRKREPALMLGITGSQVHRDCAGCPKNLCINLLTPHKDRTVFPRNYPQRAF